MTINITNLIKEEPYKIFNQYYKKALLNNQKAIEAICISSLNNTTTEVESRFVNLKYIKKDEWIFFSNYNSNKAQNFLSHNQISAVFYWDSIDTQIRIKAKIRKTSESFSDTHFNLRSKEKNSLSVSSNQSSKTPSYKKVHDNYQRVLNDYNKSHIRPEYWGGYSFFPYYFEFWRGHEYRINRRDVYVLKDNNWSNYKLQP